MFLFWNQFFKKLSIWQWQQKNYININFSILTGGANFQNCFLRRGELVVEVQVHRRQGSPEDVQGKGKDFVHEADHSAAWIRLRHEVRPLFAHRRKCKWLLLSLWNDFRNGIITIQYNSKEQHKWALQFARFTKDSENVD